MHDHFKTDDPYLATHNLGLLQRQAGVDPELADLVVAYARLVTDSGHPLNFEHAVFDPHTPEHRIHQRLILKNPDVDRKVLGFFAAYGASMVKGSLPVIYNIADFSRRWGIGKQKLMWISFHQRHYYRELHHPKKNGKIRVILAPRQPMRGLQKWIQAHILSHKKPHPSAHGFVKGRSTVTHARHHAGKRVVVRLDIEDFFPSIKHQSIRKIFQQIGYPYRVAVLLANLCTVDGRLPQGAITSPALANLTCVNLDRRFSGLQKKLKFQYTRYADDLTFSSDNPKLPSLIPFFREILSEEGFRVQESKTRVMRQGYRQMVTGLVVNETPNLPRKQMRRLRAAVHRYKTKGPGEVRLPSRKGGEQNSVKVLSGHLAYLNMIHPEKAQHYKDVRILYSMAGYRPDNHT